MQLYDITLAVSPTMLYWPGERHQPAQTWLARQERGNPANESAWTLYTHTGTHMDAPLHFVPGGATMEAQDLTRCIGPTLVADLTHVASGEILPEHLASIPNLGRGGHTRLLCKTSNALHRLGTTTFQRDFVAFGGAGAAWLIEHGVQTIGIDYLSIEVFENPGFPAHHQLLSAGVTVIEGLDLRAIAPGEYTLICLPLKLAGGEGAPARAILMREA